MCPGSNEQGDLEIWDFHTLKRLQAWHAHEKAILALQCHSSTNDQCHVWTYACASGVLRATRGPSPRHGRDGRLAQWAMHTVVTPPELVRDKHIPIPHFCAFQSVRMSDKTYMVIPMEAGVHAPVAMCKYCCTSRV